MHAVEKLYLMVEVAGCPTICRHCQAVLARALASSGQPYDELRFDLDPVPGVADLAARHGDSSGKAVHFTATSARYLWLDRAQRARRT